LIAGVNSEALSLVVVLDPFLVLGADLAFFGRGLKSVSDSTGLEGGVMEEDRLVAEGGVGEEERDRLTIL